MPTRGNKAKGTRAERELLAKFWDVGWAAIRTAGSGSMRYPSPDIVAGNATRKVAIECKTTKDQSKYLPKEDVADFKTFCQKFNAEAWIVKFPERDWLFLTLEDMEETGKAWAINAERSKMKGLSFEELIEMK